MSSACVLWRAWSLANFSSNVTHISFSEASSVFRNTQLISFVKFDQGLGLRKYKSSQCLSSLPSFFAHFPTLLSFTTQPTTWRIFGPLLLKHLILAPPGRGNRVKKIVHASILCIPPCYSSCHCIIQLCKLETWE